MNTYPRIKSKDLNENYIDLFFELGSLHRERLAEEFGVELICDDTGYAAFEEYFYEEIGKMTDPEFINLYGERNFARLERQSKGTRSRMRHFYCLKIKSLILRLLSKLGMKRHLRTQEPDISELPF